MTRPAVTLARVGLAVFVTAFAVTPAAAVPADAAARKSINTPGYKGTRKAPETRSTTPKPKTVKVGAGLEPDILVDAAGTAHVAWNDKGAPYALHYCRLKRGASACDVRKDFPQSTRGYWSPIVVAYGDQLVLLWQAAAGAERAGPVYAYVSDDGGTNFLEPALVGGPVADASGNVTQPGASQARLLSAVTFGPAGSEQIALGFSGGFFQAVRPGAPPAPLTDLLPASDQSQRVYGTGSVAAAGTGLSAAYGGIGGSSAFVRTWNRTGDAGDPAQWSAPARLPEASRASLPELTGGPSGIFVQTMHPSGRGGTVQLRKLDAAGTPGAPIVLFRELIGDTHTPVQDGAGNITTAWTLGNTTVGRLGDVVTRSISGGTRAGKLTTLLTTNGTQTFLGPKLATLPDGSGFVATSRSPGSEILVRAFGSQAATGKLGLGKLPGGGPNTAQGVLETCSRIEFGAVDVAGQGGCLLSAVGNPRVKVSESTIRLNGLEIIPDRNVKILFNSRERTINTTGAVTVQLRADGVTIPLFRGELHLNLPGGDPDTTTAAPGCTGTKLLGFDSAVSSPSLKGFPVQGQIAVFLREDSLCIPVSLGLPKALGGIRGNAVLEADNTRGLHLTSLKIVAPTIPVGPVLIQDLTVSYTAGPEDIWNGSARLTFPPGFVLGADVTFNGGDFQRATVTVSPVPWPGTPLFSGVYLNTVTGGFGVDPLSLTIGARVGALPTKPPDGYAVAVQGAITATFKDPFTLELGGTGELFGFQVARLDVLINSDLYFQASANVDIDLALAAFSGGLKAFVDGPRGQFGGEIAARLKVFGYDVGKAEAVVSSIGLGGCGEVNVLGVAIEAGAGYKWGDSIPFGVKTMWGDCDLGDYRIAAPGPGARARAAQAGGFTVAAGSTLASVRVAGAGGPPGVVLISPTGERITPVAPGARGAGAPKAIAGVSGSENATYIAIPKPAPGRWTLESQAGSPAIAEVKQATPLPEPKVTADVGGKGHARTLSYTVDTTPGRRFSFFEKTPRGERLIGTAKGPKGTLKFAPAPGAGGLRVIEALVEQDGLPRGRVALAGYVAPAPARPTAVRGVKARRAKGGVVVTWRGGAGASSFLVKATISDGRRIVYVATRRRLRIPAIATGTRLTVSVRGRNKAGRLGKPGSVTKR